LAVVVVNGNPYLFQVVETLRPASRLARGLDGGQQECHQNPDDGYDNQQLNQGECTASGGWLAHVPNWLLAEKMKFSQNIANLINVCLRAKRGGLAEVEPST
jgi:hypothetical protein